MSTNLNYYPAETPGQRASRIDAEHRRNLESLARTVERHAKHNDDTETRQKSDRWCLVIVKGQRP